MKRAALISAVLLFLVVSAVATHDLTERESARAAGIGNSIADTDEQVFTDNGGAAFCGTSDPNPLLYYGGGTYSGWYPDHYFGFWARDHHHHWYFPDPFTPYAFLLCAVEFGAPL